MYRRAYVAVCEPRAAADGAKGGNGGIARGIHETRSTKWQRSASSADNDREKCMKRSWLWRKRAVGDCGLGRNLPMCANLLSGQVTLRRRLLNIYKHLPGMVKDVKSMKLAA